MPASPEMSGAARTLIDDDPSLHVKFARLDERLHMTNNSLQGIVFSQQQMTSVLAQIQVELTQVAKEGGTAVATVAREFREAQVRQADQFTSSLKERDMAMERSLTNLGEKFIEKPNLYKWVEWGLRALMLAVLGYGLTKVFGIPISLH